MEQSRRRPAYPSAMGPPREVCAGFCCVGKRFSASPFRLPVARAGSDGASVPAADDALGVKVPSGEVERRSGLAPSEPASAAPDGAPVTSAGDASRDPTPRGASAPDNEEETEAEEAAARACLTEILDAVAADADASREGGASLRAFVDAHLDRLAHLSHRRERHCRVILQHPAADRVVHHVADILAARDHPDRDASSRELAEILAHNLSLAAAAREPREEDRHKPKDDDDHDEDANEDGVKDPMLSLVNHPRWEGMLLDLFRAVKTEIAAARTRESRATSRRRRRRDAFGGGSFGRERGRRGR